MTSGKRADSRVSWKPPLSSCLGRNRSKTPWDGRSRLEVEPAPGQRSARELVPIATPQPDQGPHGARPRGPRRPTYAPTRRPSGPDRDPAGLAEISQMSVDL